LIDHYVNSTLKELVKAGFTGENILLAAHSLGGVMSQKYIKKNADKIKGQILMGSVLTRDQHSLNSDGSTHFDYPTPTLTLGGTKDGLMRVSRMAEAYYHQIDNIEKAQQGMFPVFAL
jgi:predicted alpha/beta hydrolase family esterase